MSLGNSFFDARKKSGLSQEEVAEKLGVSRQTVSKWETDETIPDIRQAKKMASIYKLSLDELINFDIDVKEIEDIIEKTDEKLQNKIDWTFGVKNIPFWRRIRKRLIQYHTQKN